MKNVYSAIFFWVLPALHSRGRRTDFHTQYVNRRGSTQGFAFLGLEDQNLTLYPSYCRKLLFLGPLLTGLRKWPKTTLQWRLLCYTSPLRQCRSE